MSYYEDLNLNIYFSGWKSREDVNIPPLENKGFTEDIIIRKHIEPKKSMQNIQSLNAMDDETVMLYNSTQSTDDETTILLNERRIVITVIRMKTGEEKEVLGNEFLLGKAKDCDFIITNNSTISRYYSCITKENGDYYLKDLKSTNHTYVDNCELIEPVRVMKDMVFKMSDENFKISVEIK